MTEAYAFQASNQRTNAAYLKLKKISQMINENISIYCYSGYQVFLINSFYLALVVM